MGVSRGLVHAYFDEPCEEVPLRVRCAVLAGEVCGARAVEPREGEGGAVAVFE